MTNHSKKIQIQYGIVLHQMAHNLLLIFNYTIWKYNFFTFGNHFIISISHKYLYIYNKPIVVIPIQIFSSNIVEEGKI